MTIPADFDGVFDWFNAKIGELAQNNSEFQTFEKYWAQWTPAQRTLIKNLVKGRIATGRTDLAEIEAHIDSIPVD